MQLTSRFNLGDIVYEAGIKATTTGEKCDTCAGTSLVTYTHTSSSGDVESVTLRCTAKGCRDGLKRHTIERSYVPAPSNLKLTIGKIQVEVYEGELPSLRISYMCKETGVGSGRNFDEAQLGASPEEARTISDAMASQAYQRDRQEALDKMSCLDKLAT